MTDDELAAIILELCLDKSACRSVPNPTSQGLVLGYGTNCRF